MLHRGQKGSKQTSAESPQLNLLLLPLPTALYGLPQATKCLQAYADSKGPGQPAHARSLIRVSLSIGTMETQSVNTIESKGLYDTLYAYAG